MFRYEARSPVVQRNKDAWIAGWLIIVCALIVVVVVIGGYTRLTNSGLSMVEWKPLSGVVPPLTEEQWQDEFELYQQYPEFRFVYPDISLDGFKKIFWVEFVHRVAGRILGVVFFVPFMMLAMLGFLERSQAIRLLLVLILGGLQGLLGWYMVKSGLVQEPSVSQYRLTAHLGLAVLIYGYVLWLASGLLLRYRPKIEPVAPRTKVLALLCLLAVVLMQVSGGMMSGTHAGYAINTFPDMNGEYFPDGMMLLTPAWRNLFENIITIQFVHRWIAIATVLLVVLLWMRRFREQSKSVQLLLDIFLAAAVLQLALGITTLLSRVALPVALAHQAGFILLFSVLVVLLRTVSFPESQRVELPLNRL